MDHRKALITQLLLQGLGGGLISIGVDQQNGVIGGLIDQQPVGLGQVLVEYFLTRNAIELPRGNGVLRKVSAYYWRSRWRYAYYFPALAAM
ncbi:MAG: hypothetical protein AAFZ63_10660 [Bacteroidota bacterium]